MPLYKNCGWWKNFDCIFGFSVKSYVRNTINLSWDKILLTSVIKNDCESHSPLPIQPPHTSYGSWYTLALIYQYVVRKTVSRGVQCRSITIQITHGRLELTRYRYHITEVGCHFNPSAADWHNTHAIYQKSWSLYWAFFVPRKRCPTNAYKQFIIVLINSSTCFGFQVPSSGGYNILIYKLLQFVCVSVRYELLFRIESHL
jgi:hypothetical protein